MTVIYFLITIVLLVGIHEWGHFIAARIFGVGVSHFTIGFGRQFIAWTDQKTGTSWGIAPFLLGGYVKLRGENNTLEPVTNKKTVVIGQTFMAAPLYAKVFILLAGPLANIVSALFMYAALAYYAPLMPAAVLATPTVNSPAFLSGLKSGDKIIALNGHSINHWRDVQMTLLTADINQPLLFKVLRPIDGDSHNKKIQAITVNSFAKGNIPNQNYEAYLGLRLQTQGILLEEVFQNGAATQAGLKKNDVLMRVNGIHVDSPDVLFERLNTYGSNTTAPLNLHVFRQGSYQSFNVQPVKDLQGIYKLGIKFSSVFIHTEQKNTVLNALSSGLTDIKIGIHLTIKALIKVFVSPFVSNQIGGPIAIASMAHSSVTQGWTSTVAFLAGLSISIAVLNLLPIPMLDGGQIIYHSIRQTLHTTGLAFKMKDKLISSYLNKIWSYFGVGFVFFLTLIALITDVKTFL